MIRPSVVTPPPSETRVRLIVIAVVAALVILVIGVAGVGLVLAVAHGSTLARATNSPRAQSGRPLSATTPLTSATGTLIFTDDFHDPQSGWAAASVVSGVDYGYVKGVYVTTVKDGLIYPNSAPYSEPKQQLSVGATATLEVHTPPDAGFGVDCVRGSGASQVAYEFEADADSNWYVRRSEGPDSTTNFPTTVQQGSIKGAPAPGVISVTLVGVCATMADGKTTRLAFFIDGSKVADLTDIVSSSVPEGWVTDLITAGSDSGPVTVTVTHFDMRDLSRSGP